MLTLAVPGAAFLAFASGTATAAPSEWTFADPADRFAAESGTAELGFYDPFGTGWGPLATSFGKASSFGLPAMPGGGDPDVMAFPGCTVDEGYSILHGVEPNGAYGDTFGLVSNYTFILDVYYPSSSDGAWRALWQTDPFNGSDGEFFVQNQASGGVGISGNYRGTVTPDAWHRIAVVVRAAPGEGQAHRFIDGQFVGGIGTTGSGLDERWALDLEVLLFTDNDDETRPGYVSGIYFVDRALTMDEVAALGGPAAGGASTPGAPAPGYSEKMPRAPLAIGHRGGSFCCAPDNTLAAVRQAFLDGAAGVEVDTRLTADGVSVCFHDETLDRTTDGEGFVDEYTLEELKAFDAGTSFDPAFAGEKIPSLTEVMVEANGKGIVFLDMKVDGQAGAIKAALDESGFPVGDLWIWVPGDEAEAAAIRGVIPGAQIVEGTPDPAWRSDPSYFDDLLARGVVGFSFGFGSGAASLEFCASAKQHGMFVEVFTILDPDVMIQAAAAGVDYIETDFPATVRDLQPEQGAAATSPVPPDGAEVGSATAVLGWVPALAATSHRVHFGRENPPPFLAEQGSDLFVTPAIEPGGTYYWRIDEVTPGGTVTGPVWSLTTPLPEPTEPVQEFRLNGDLTAALGTSILEFSDPGTEAQVSFETTDGTTVPHIGGVPAGYLAIPGFFDNLDGLSLSLQDIQPNGGGAYVNQFTFVFDVFIPFDLYWLPFFNTDPNNNNDADFFVRDDGAIGIGALGYAPGGTIVPDTWLRVAFSADLSSGNVAYYVDGNLVHRRTGGPLTDGRFALFSSAEPAPHVRLFGDENGETHDVHVAAIGFVAEALSDAQVASLGGPDAAGIFGPGTTPGPPASLEISRVGDNIQLDWLAAPERFLQRSADLLSTGWTDLPATLGGDSYSEAISLGTEVYFRLAEPE